jgi:hypothetical protein
MTKPTVSVLINVFNGEKYVTAAVQSILNQTFTDFEVLIMDDGSTDDTAQIVEEFARRDDRVRVFHQQNQGPAGALNPLIGYAQGQYLAHLDADDVAYPERLRRQVDYLNQWPEVGLVSCWTQIISSNDTTLMCYCYPDDHAWLVNQLEAVENPLVHSSVMIRRPVLDRVSPVYRFRYILDYDLWLRLSTLTRFGVVQDVLLAYRRHGGQITANYRQQRERLIHLIYTLHQRRQAGEPEGDWQAEQRAIFAAPAAPSSTPERDMAYAAYVEAVSLQLYGGSRQTVRQLLRLAMGVPHLKRKAQVRWALTLLPGTLFRSLLHRNARRRDSILFYHRPLEQVLSPTQIQQVQAYWDRMNGEAGHD